MKRRVQEKLIPCVVALAALFILYGYDLLTTGGNFSRGLVLSAWEAGTGKLSMLEEATTSTAPDGRSHVVVAPSGSVRWYDVRTGRTLAKRTVPPKEYRRVKVFWLSNRQVALIQVIRYPMLAADPFIILDRDKGEVSDRAIMRRVAQRIRKAGL